MKKLLTQMVAQYQAKHQKLPGRIVVTPVVLVFLALKRTIAPTWSGIPVECREIKAEDVAANGPLLGVDIKEGSAVSFDLAK